MKQTDLQGLSSALADVTQKIKNGSTNVAGAKIQDAKYQAALGALNQLKAERSSLEKKMQDEESAEASRPTGITAEIIDSAETPRKPFTPNGRLALGIIGAGGFLLLAGLVVLLAGQREVKASDKQTG